VIAQTNGPIATTHRRRRLLRRGPWEAGATGLIGVGVFMLMQPFSLWLYTYSFATILAGTLAFVVVSHFPD
jgi:hypothetical protein